MRPMNQHIETMEVERERLETLFFELQRERIALTGAIMSLRGESRPGRARIVMRVMVALLRLQRANRSAAAVLGLSKSADLLN
jgi:hypothetical protein